MKRQQKLINHKNRNSVFLNLVMLIFGVLPFAHAEITCPLDDVGSISSTCLSGQCIMVSTEIKNPPCNPPGWVPAIFHGLFCPHDGDVSLDNVSQCANECPEHGGGCADGQTCVTQAGGDYLGSGNGLCVIDDSPTLPIAEDPPTTTGDDACDDDQTWVSNPSQYQSGSGQCQTTDQLAACCYQPDDFSDLSLIEQTAFVCRVITPNSCPGNDVCSISGYCYERPDRNPRLIEHDLQRDPSRFPPQPGD